VHDWDDIAELALERRVEIRAALDGSEAIGVCELSEHANVAAIFKLDACVEKGLSDVPLARWIVILTGCHGV
jgi:hypothetical protein